MTNDIEKAVVNLKITNVFNDNVQILINFIKGLPNEKELISLVGNEKIGKKIYKRIIES